MKIIKILNHQTEVVKEITSVNVIKVGYMFTELEHSPELENLLLLHNIGIY